MTARPLGSYRWQALAVVGARHVVPVRAFRKSCRMRSYEKRSANFFRMRSYEKSREGWEPDPYRSSVQVKIAVVLAEPDLGIKQFREVFFAEDRGLGPVRKNPSFAQQHHSRDFRNDFRHVVGHQQNAQSGLRQLAHRFAKLQLRADVQRIARLIEE